VGTKTNWNRVFRAVGILVAHIGTRGIANCYLYSSNFCSCCQNNALGGRCLAQFVGAFGTYKNPTGKTRLPRDHRQE